MKRFIIALSFISIISGTAFAASTFDSGVKEDIKNRQVDLDDRYAVVFTPTSQKDNKILIVNRRTGQFYKVEMTEIGDDDE